MAAYYNENEPYPAQWLRNLIAERLIPPGDVDERSIVDVQPDDLRDYTQCHFFAGIGGWAYAARLAGWPDDRELWTGSCPCQPFSVAGKGRGHDDERHLWPHYFRLVAACRPAVAMGEQVAAAVGKDWLDGVFADLEGIGYACGATVVPACAVNAPHRRDRIWFVAHAPCEGRGQTGRASECDPETYPRWQGNRACHAGQNGFVADADGAGQCARIGDGTASRYRHSPSATSGAYAWNQYDWITGHDGKARRIPEPESGIRLLAHGVPARVGKLRAYGNAIVPELAAEVIAAYMEE